MKNLFLSIVSFLFFLHPLMADGYVNLWLGEEDDNLYYHTTEPICGFQFEHDGCVEWVGGGDAENAGFSISMSSTIVLGFSLTGSCIPVGTGMLVALEGDVTQDCLSNFLLSNSDGWSLEVYYPSIPTFLVHMSLEMDAWGQELIYDEYNQVGFRLDAT